MSCFLRLCGPRLQAGRPRREKSKCRERQALVRELSQGWIQRGCSQVAAPPLLDQASGDLTKVPAKPELQGSL